MNRDKFKYSILYVEDDDNIRANYILFLQRFFDVIYEAANAEDAYEIYKKQKIDILLIDINLPNQSGIEFLKNIRKHNHSVRAIMLTGMNDVETLINASELKLTKYLLKPISRDELQKALEIAVDEIINYTTYANRIIHIQNLCYWDQDREKFISHAKEVFLTRKERELLALLFSNVNKVFNTEEIIFELWYEYDNLKISSLKTLIKKLRKKLPIDVIKNVFGIGYTIEV